jgi:hypothetical protein
VFGAFFGYHNSTYRNIMGELQKDFLGNKEDVKVW